MEYLILLFKLIALLALVVVVFFGVGMGIMELYDFMLREEDDLQETATPGTKSEESEEEEAWSGKEVHERESPSRQEK
jgi:hypothetical protein